MSTNDSRAGRDLIFPAPAKINLFLHITGRREDGYHRLQTLFQFLDYVDQLTFTTNCTGLIQRTDNHCFDLPERDLSVQAARLLREHAGRPDLGCHIHLQKSIPPGSGLGGGSSNAATTLLALNRLWELALEPDILLGMARRLGADVPVFVHGHAAWAEGTGDQLVDFTAPQDWYLVVVPPVLVSTSRVFAESGLRRDHPAMHPGNYRYDQTCNDLEPVTTALFPEVDRALTVLGGYAERLAGPGANPVPPRMSGSGCAVFLPCPDQQSALSVRDECLQRLNQDPCSRGNQSFQGFVTRGRNTSPLHTVLTEAALV